jgi:ribosomal peptide maturation radical SAM protein 1
LKVDTYHAYLRVAEAIGYDTYKEISERTWLSEASYASLLYPERHGIIDRFWGSRSAAIPELKKAGLDKIKDRLSTVTEEILKDIIGTEYDLVGLSICLGQLTSSLYFIHRMKQACRSLKVLVGGSACSGEMGRSLLAVFPEIDYVIGGEGELPLTQLIQRLLYSEGEEGADEKARPEIEPLNQVAEMDSLPEPDFGDYFNDLGSFTPEKRFLPKLPMEISRGCWWRGCAFCNLNLQWKGYRSKNHQKVLKELEGLSERYELLSISFMDNLLPLKGLGGLFKGISGLGKDFRLFAEIRATTSRKVLSAMSDAGMREVQVGIEALSSRLLKRLNKGTTAILNLEIMKTCEAPGMPELTGNLILSFPGSDETDVAETLHALEFAAAFRPLKGIPFWLGYGSPVWQQPKAYGLTRVHNHPHYQKLFPPSVFKKLIFMIQGYHGGYRIQQNLWRPVKETIEAWNVSYQRLHERPRTDPILSYQDGGSFLVIRQRRQGDDDMTHRLKGTSREIYLFCEKNRSIKQILSHTPGFGEEKVLPFLRMLVDKRLMFNERDRYLSLAVPLKGWQDG